MVPPRGQGIAYGHSADGRCVSVTGERYRLLDLFRELRAFCHGRRERLEVSPDDWTVSEVQRADCPAHDTPETMRDRYGCYAPY